jgi:DNA-binding LacI/PurR family transcriptional regulator
MGARAVEVLLARLAGEDVPAVTVVDCPLVERASV